MANPKPQKYRSWEFRVACQTFPGETVCVSGDCSQLGHWKHDKPFILHKDSSSSDPVPVWTGKIQLPFREVKFRFFVCTILDHPMPGADKVFVVRRWETNLKPRIITKDVLQEPAQDRTDDLFGSYDNSQKLEHGWLTAESVIQFKISNGPINFWRKKHKNATIKLKMVPMNLNRQCSIAEIPDMNSMDYQDSSSAFENEANASWPIIEVAVINETDYQFTIQEQFGKPYQGNDIMVFQAQVLQLETVAYMIDFYMERPNEEIPVHIGFCHILPVNLRESLGTITMPISSLRQEPIGQIMIEYVVIRPLKESNCNLSISYSRHWKHSWKGLDIGHRGSGNSQKELKQCANIRENTIASLQQAADHGADFVEFDVQLSKDLVPVLFHDFHVNIGLNQKARKGGGLTKLRIPVKDLTLSQLHELKISHETEDPEENDEPELHEPFPTLQYALEHISSHVGFNIEIKWTMQLKDGTYELNNPFELNMFIDIVLQAVLQHAKKRRIVFSSFHPDICVMLRLKQNKYPVLFLTQGVTSKYPEYNDPRTQNTPVAINFALFAGILGLNMHTEDILREPTLVKTALSHGLITFCWGDDNNNVGTIKYMKELGINGVIYDRIEEHIEQKESIFLTDDAEDLIQIAACLSPSSPVNGYSEDSSCNDTPDNSETMEINGNSKTNGKAQHNNETSPAEPVGNDIQEIQSRYLPQEMEFKKVSFGLAR